VSDSPSVAVLKPQPNEEITATSQVDLNTLDQLKEEEEEEEESNNVKPLNENKSQPSQPQAQVTEANVAQSNKIAASSVHYNLGDELRSVTHSSRVIDVEVQAKIKIAVLESQTELIAKHAQETKLLEYKINKLIKQIHAKAPAAKAELLQIRKLLSEHAKIGDSQNEEEEQAVQASKKEPTQNAPPKKKLSPEEKEQIRKKRALAQKNAAKKKAS